MRTQLLRAATIFFLLIAGYFAIDTTPVLAQEQVDDVVDLVNSTSSEVQVSVVSADANSNGINTVNWTELNLYSKKEARAYFNLSENVPVTLTWRLEDTNGMKYGPFVTNINKAGKHELTDGRVKFPDLQPSQFVTLTTAINGGPEFSVSSEFREGGPQWITIVPIKDAQERECSAYRVWHNDIVIQQRAFWTTGELQYPQYEDHSGNDDGQTPEFNYPATDQPFWVENTSWNPKNQIKHHSIRGPYTNPCFVKPVAYVGITKTSGEEKVQAGQPIHFSLVVTTSGTTTATNVVLVDHLPQFPGANWTLLSFTQFCGISGFELNCKFGNVPSGSILTVDIMSTTTAETAPVCGNPVVINNIGTVTSDNGGTDNDDASTPVECLPNPKWEAKRITAVAYKNTGNVDLSAGQIIVPGCNVTFSVLHPGETGYFVCEATSLEGTATYNGQPVNPDLGILAYLWTRDPEGNWIFLPILLR